MTYQAMRTIDGNSVEVLVDEDGGISFLECPFCGNDGGDIRHNDLGEQGPGVYHGGLDRWDGSRECLMCGKKWWV